MSDWTDDQVAQLRQLWDEGCTTVDIGRRLGVTKNAVVGKKKRLKLPDRPSQILACGTKKPPSPKVNVAHYINGTARAVRLDDKRRGAIVGPTLPPQQLASLGRRPPPQMPESLTVEQLRLKLTRVSESSPHRTCQWVTGERPWTFCGKPSAYRRCDDGETVHWYSWCPVHYARVFARRVDVARAA